MPNNNEYTNEYDFSFSNTTLAAIPCSFRIRRPDFFFKNLNKKTMRCYRFTINNTEMPLFIPLNVTSQTYFNVSSNAGSSNTYVNNTLNANSLQYFIIVRDQANLNAVTTYIQQIPESPSLTPPPFPVTDPNSYYQNPYYYYHDFSHWLTIIANTINAAATTLGQTAGCNIVINNSGGGYSFTFYFNSTFIASYQVEFSKTLLDIFELKNLVSPYTTGQNSYILQFSDFVTSSGSVTYKVISCPAYESTFVFSEFLISSDDLGINFTSFINNSDLLTNTSQGGYESTILSYSVRSADWLGYHDYFDYVNQNDSLWKSFYLDECNKQHMTINIYLRLKNNILLPFMLAPGELFSLTLHGKYRE